MDLSALVNTIESSLPAILALIRAEHANANPGAPPLTDAQVFAAFHDWVTQTVAKDDALAADIRARNPGL